MPDASEDWWLTAGWPHWLGQHSEVAGHAVVVNFAYGRQRKYSRNRIDSLLKNYSELARLQLM